MTTEKVLCNHLNNKALTAKQAAVISSHGIETVGAVNKSLLDLYTTATVNGWLDVREKVRKHYDSIKGYGSSRLLVNVFSDDEKLISIDDVKRIIKELNK